MERRSFVKGACNICAVALLGGLGGILESCKKSKIKPKVNFTIDLSNPSNSALNTIGGSIIQQGVIVVHASNGYIAFSDSCTHQGCAVSYSASSNTFVCPCHNGVFDINGAVIGGPPPSSLPRYNTSLSGNILTIS
jgi:cytochrome b6-f complex iron-sulfur subunit